MNSQNPATACTVSFYDANGGACQHRTLANNRFEAVRKAWKWFHSDDWDGPLPMRDTVFTVVAVDRGTFRVLASQALHCHPEQAPLFDSGKDAFDPR